MRLGLACALLTRLNQLRETRLFDMRSCALTEPTLTEEATLNYMRKHGKFSEIFAYERLDRIYIYHKFDLFWGGASG